MANPLLGKDYERAFPASPHYQRDGDAQFFYEGAYGMTLRDYFAAHAPERQASWFSPRMPPEPAPIYDHDHPSVTCLPACVGPTNAAERLAWWTENQRQAELQWPYAYADAMLVERAKEPPSTNAVDPHAQSSGTPPPRGKASSS